MPSAHPICSLNQRLILIHGQFFQDWSSDHSMLLHDLKFFICQLATLVQNLIINTDLTNIVKGWCHHDCLAVLPGQIILIRLLHKSAQEHLSQYVDMLYMCSAFSVTKLNDVAQNTDHDLTVLLLVFHLLWQNGCQTPLLCIQLDRIMHTSAHNHSIIRTSDIIGYSHLICCSDKGIRILTGYHDNRNIIDNPFTIHLLQHFKSIHNRHHNIQKNQWDPPAVPGQHIQCLFAIFCLQCIKIVLQHLTQNGSVHLRIIYDQDTLIRLLLTCRQHCMLWHLYNSPFRRNRILMCLCLIHISICSCRDVANRLILRHDAADANRYLLIMAVRYFCRWDQSSDLSELSIEVILRNARHHQQKFIAADTHQRICLTDQIQDHRYLCL